MASVYPDRVRFRNSINNNRLLKQLFFEQTLADKSQVVYTLKDIEHEGFPSFYQLYMELDDPTEWKVSQNLVDGWGHWELLCNCNWFEPHVLRWRKELELRYKSLSLDRVRNIAKVPSKEQLNANKYLLEKGWEPKATSNGRGRPSKAEVTQAANTLAENSSIINKDFERLGIYRNN